jgi:hypothetical protein
MQQARRLSNPCLDGASIDFTSDSASAPARVVPHAGTGGAVVETPSPSTAHKGGGPPAEQSPAQEAAEAALTDPYGPAASLHSPQR